MKGDIEEKDRDLLKILEERLQKFIKKRCIVGHMLRRGHVFGEETHGWKPVCRVCDNVIAFAISL